MCVLTDFHPEQGPQILSWIRTPEELQSWAAEACFPLTDPAIFTRWGDDSDVAQYVLREGDRVCGYGETWCEPDELWAELGRLVVDYERRNRGLGKLLVEQLIGRVAREGFDHVWIRVFPDRPWTEKAAEVPMGKGKGEPQGFCFEVEPGRILFEVSGVSDQVAKEALRKGGTKMPLKSKVVARH